MTLVDRISAALAGVAADIKAISSSKNSSNGYPGLTGFGLNLRNTAGTHTNYVVNTTTLDRTWTLPDKDGTFAMTSDLAALSATQPSSIVVNSSIAALHVEQQGGGASFEVYDVATDTTPFLIDQDGTTLIGMASPITVINSQSGGSQSAHLQVSGATSAASSLTLAHFQNTSIPPQLTFAKSDAGSIGGHTSVISGDGLGAVSFQGSDGAAFVRSGLIRCDVDGTVATGAVPGRIILSTASASGTMTERARINSSGTLLVGTSTDDGTAKLQVGGNIKASGAVLGSNVSGTNTGDQTITLTGDVTGSGGGSFVATIGANKVTLAQMAQMAAASFLGRNTAGTGNVEVLSVSTVKTALAVNNVDNVSDANKPVSIAQAAADAATLNSAKSYADGLVVGLWDDRSNYDASVNTFPATGGSGAGGAILKGDIWTISVAGTLGGVSMAARQTVRAMIDSPGQTAANWAIGLANTDLDDSITLGVAGRAPSQNAVAIALSIKEAISNKDVSGGYVGLSGYQIRFKNSSGGNASYLAQANTAIRTYTFPDASGTIALISDISGKADLNGAAFTGAVSTTGDLNVAGVSTLSGQLLQAQSSPASVNATTSLTGANLASRIITSAPSTTCNLTLPTGTVMDAYFSWIGIDESFDWSVINTASGFAAALVSSAGHTIVGVASTVALTSSMFRTRKTATATYVTYRVG